VAEGPGVEVFVVWLLFGVAAAMVAANKGLGGCLWFGLGILFGPFGLIFALVTPADQQGVETKALQSGAMKRCPSCAELVRADASRCRYCHADVGGERTPFD
jgi:hypothetical protein